jgi:hypothetical protein
LPAGREQGCRQAEQVEVNLPGIGAALTPTPPFLPTAVKFAPERVKSRVAARANHGHRGIRSGGRTGAGVIFYIANDGSIYLRL